MVALAAVGWGTWPLVLDLANRRGKMDVALQSVIVMIAITLTAAPLLSFDRVSARASVRQWLGVAWLGFADAMNVICLFRAYAMTTVGIAVVTHYLAPILVSVASPFVLRERSRSSTWVAVVIAFAGLVIMLRPWDAQLGSRDAAGGMFGVASAAFYASNVLVNKRILHVFSPSELMFFHGLVAIPLLGLLVPSGAWSDFRWGSALILFAGGVGPGALGGLLFVAALRRIPASHAMTLTLIEPLTAFIVGIVALRQTVPMVSALGAILILGSTASVMRSGGLSSRVS
jgi:drug/metabolite transporter (DMT)-like permease